jgi:hypothetical protein
MKRLEPEDKRTEIITGYVTKNEQTAVNLLAVDVYRSKSEVIRRALACLIRTEHPNYAKYLRASKTP